RLRAAQERRAFRPATAGDGPWLVVYYHVDDERGPPHWPPPANARWVMTSRIAKGGTNVTAVAVGEWTTAEAVRYLRAESGRADLTDAGAERLATEPGLPLPPRHPPAHLRKGVHATAESYLNAPARPPQGIPHAAGPP